MGKDEVKAYESGYTIDAPIDAYLSQAFTVEGSPLRTLRQQSVKFEPEED